MTAVQANDNRGERPTLLLALIGFSAQETTVISDVLRDCREPGLDWRLAGIAHADAWWANGARAQLLPDGSVRIGSAVSGGRSIRLSLDGVDRPIAFSHPVASPELEPACTFSLDSPQSMQQTLALLQGWLWPVTGQLCLAAHLLSEQDHLTSRVFHVIGRGRLLAVVDRSGEVGLAPGVQPQDFVGAAWQARPSSARHVPAGYMKTSISKLAWLYALRTTSDLLPAKYRTGLIYFRRPPRLSQRLVRDEHLVIMRELAAKPATFAELEDRTGLPSATLATALAALYLVGSITTSAHRAARSNGAAMAEDRGQGSAFGSLWPASRHSTSAAPLAKPGSGDLTVPGFFDDGLLGK